MSSGSLTSQRPWRPVRITDRQRLAAIVRSFRAASTNSSDDQLTEFDVEAWTELIAEYRHRIAVAAGVDPSRVKIQIGH